MKKLLFLMIFPFLIASCTVYTTNQANIQSVDITVNQSDWIEHTDSNGLNRYYSCVVSMPEITQNICDYGSLQTYIYTSDATQEILPYVRHYEDVNGDLWTRTIDCDYAAGSISFYVTNSDFYQQQPETMSFRVVILSE